MAKHKKQSDPVTDYAERVLSSDIIAGPHVRDACNRHIDDLSRGHLRGLVWSIADVERVKSFFEQILTVEIEYTDDEGESVSEAVPFILEPSQIFIIGSIFGWKKRGLRRFRRAYVEIGKGNGKSPLAAGIGHYMLTAQKKLRAEVYSAATDKDQAAILFRDAVAMWERSPNLFKRIIPSGQNPVWQLTMPATSSFFKPISSEKKGKSGIRPFCSLVDEIHEHKDNSVIEMLRAGTKGNREALMFEITNSGFDRSSVCWQEHEYSIKVCRGEIENDNWFAYVCALDEKDDPFEDESCWIKANPLLGVSIHHEFIREQVVEAKGIPDKQSLVKRLHFCVWSESANPLISYDAWLACKDTDCTIEAGEKIYLGLDLAETTDLCALVAVSATNGDRLKAWFWKPKGMLRQQEEKDRVPYVRWAEEGYITACDGNCIEYADVAKKITEIWSEYTVLGMAYDRWRIKNIIKELAGLQFDVWVDKSTDEDVKDGSIEGPAIKSGLRIIPWGQGYKDMGAAVDAIEKSVNKSLKHDGNPVLTWNIGNATVAKDPAGNRKLDKSKSRFRIDGAQAATMAIGLKYREIEKVKEEWDGTVITA